MHGSTKQKTAFEQAGEGPSHSLLLEFIYFMNQNKKWWLAPLLILMGLLGLLILVGGSGLAPFVYTLF